MTRDLLRETILAIGASVVAIALATGVAVMLTGCASIEGAGFENSGHYTRPLCVQKDKKGNERWYSC